jgi:predicted nucleic acid-binding protein
MKWVDAIIAKAADADQVNATNAFPQKAMGIQIGVSRFLCATGGVNRRDRFCAGTGVGMNDLMLAHVDYSHKLVHKYPTRHLP